MTDIKKLMGNAISEDTANALQTILDKALSESRSEKENAIAELEALQEKYNKINEDKSVTDDDVKELQHALKEARDEIQSLKESHELEISTLEESIEHLKEKAEEYAEQVKHETTESLSEKAEEYALVTAQKAREEAIAEMTEKADAYGEYLMEKAEEYASSVKQQTIDEMVEKGEAYGKYLMEKAEEYGSFLMEKAEDYGAFLIEEADKYTEQQVKLTEQRCLEESKKALNEFKDAYKEEFERVDEHARMATVFKNLKTLIESSGFSIDEHSQLEELNDQLRESRVKARRLERILRENEEEMKRLKIVESVQSVAEGLTFKDREKVIAGAMKARFENAEELNDVVKTLVESVKLNKNNNDGKTSNALNESANKVTSGWAGKLL